MLDYLGVLQDEEAGLELSNLLLFLYKNLDLNRVGLRYTSYGSKKFALPSKVKIILLRDIHIYLKSFTHIPHIDLD